MKSVLKIECDRAFKNIWFCITLLICITFVIYDLFTEIIPTRQAIDQGFYFLEKTENYMIPGVYSRWMDLNYTTASKLLHFLFPLLICIPYTMTIFSDMKSKFIYNIITRINKRTYFLCKLLTQFLVGFSVVAVTLTISFVLTAMILPFEHPMAGSSVYLIGVGCVFVKLFYTYPLAAVILHIIMTSVLFGIIGCISFVFSYVVGNGVIAMTSAFVFYFFEHIISQMVGMQGSMLNASTIIRLFRTDITKLIVEIIVILVFVLTAYWIRARVKDIL